MSTENQAQFLRNLTVKLFQELSTKKSENFCFSPLSLSMGLSMVLCGAKNKTATQIKQFLNLSHLTNEQIFEINKNYLVSLANLNKSGFSVNLANKIYSKSELNLNEEFMNNLSKYFESEMQQINFNNPYETVQLINEWVASKTNNKVNNLIDISIFSSINKLFLVNASFFKGKWLNKFDRQNTYEDDFYLKDGTTVKVKMMKILNKDFLFKISPCGIYAQTCTLPYLGSNLSMTIILPHEGINIEDVEAQLNGDVLKEIMFFNHDMYIGKVNIYLPKFKLDFRIELSEFMKKNGTSFAFDSFKSDFNGITKNKNDLYLTNLFHQSTVEIDEEGGENALTTIYVAMRRSAFVFDVPNVLKCNKPFLFFVHDRQTEEILYFGKIVNPNSI